MLKMNRIIHLYTLLIIVITIFSCKKGNTKEVDLIYEIGNQKITVEIDNEQDFLEYNTSTKVNFVLTNIDPYTLRIHGHGIRVLKIKDKAIVQTEINVPDNYLENDTLDVNIRFGKEDNSCQFHIPLKYVK